MRLIALLALFVLILPVPSRAGWGSGSCAGPVHSPTFQPISPVLRPMPVVEGFRWEPTNDPDQVALFQGATQLGIWRVEQGVYYRRSVDGWAQTDCPTSPPPQAKAKPPEAENFGLDVQRTKDAAKGYWLNGKQVSRQKAFEAIEAGVPDDAHLWRLTVIGPESRRRQVLADLAGAVELSAWKDRLLIQDYDPTHWAVQPGFVRTGAPTVYLQSPTGQVLHRQDDYDGPGPLAKALTRAGAVKVEAIRKPHPYDPNNPTPARPTIPLWMIVVGLGAVILLLRQPTPEVKP